MSMRPHVRCIVLIIASRDKPYYLEHMRVWKAYMHKEAELRCFFVELVQDITTDYVLTDDTIQIRSSIGEHFDLIMFKTLIAFSVVRQYFDFDFCVRTNLSTFWVLDNLLRYLRDKPSQHYLSATPCSHEGMVFPSGCGMIMSHDVVDAVLHACAFVPFDPRQHNDDVQIGRILSTFAKPMVIDPLPRFDVCGKYNDDMQDPNMVIVDTKSLPLGAIHIRNRLWNEKHRCTYEVNNMRQLLWKYYGLSLPLEMTQNAFLEAHSPSEVK